MSAPSRNTDLERFTQCLQELPSLTFHGWAPVLDVMAYSADALAFTAHTAGAGEIAAKWDDTALLLRAVAAADRGYVLSGPCGDAGWLTATCQGWTALVWAIHHGGPADRAEALYALCAEVHPWMAGSAALVLDDLAAAELATATLRLAA
jgi:hypothetical protein